MRYPTGHPAPAGISSAYLTQGTLHNALGQPVATWGALNMHPALRLFRVVYVVMGEVGFTLRLEESGQGRRRGAAYWYAFKRVDGRTRKVYLGLTEALSPAALERAAQQLLEVKA